MFTDEIATIRRLGFRHLLTQALAFATVISSALMMWKGLGVALNTPSPIVVVLSESMEPAIYRGDLLFLSMPRHDPLEIGDIVVYQMPHHDIPIVHRILERHDSGNTTDQLVLTKGDNNPMDDLVFYKRGQAHLERTHIVGRVKGYVPYVGYVTIMMEEHPRLKYALLAIVGLGVLFNRES